MIFLNSYTFLQWLLFFAVYCFFGWIFESTYVSLKKLKFTNRGFLYGPFLPIYGSGAIMLLFATLPVRDSYILTFLFGMVAATLLEYVTGVIMEAVFKVRYWDYSNQPLNFQGQICLGSSLAWGVMGVLLVNVIHKPVEHLILSLPGNLTQLLAFLFVIVFAADFTLSVREALDIRSLVAKALRENEDLQKIQKRIDVIVAFANEDRQAFLEELNELKLKYSVKKEVMSSKLESINRRYKSLKRRHPSLLSKRYNQLNNKDK